MRSNTGMTYEQEPSNIRGVELSLKSQVSSFQPASVLSGDISIEALNKFSALAGLIPYTSVGISKDLFLE